MDNNSNPTYGLKPSELDDINRSFREFDLNNNGFISRDELKQCLKRSNVVASDSTVDNVLDPMDGNHDGKISYGEYIKFMAAVYRNEHKDLKRQSSKSGSSAT